MFSGEEIMLTLLFIWIVIGLASYIYWTEMSLLTILGAALYGPVPLVIMIFNYIRNVLKEHGF